MKETKITEKIKRMLRAKMDYHMETHHYSKPYTARDVLTSREVWGRKIEQEVKVADDVIRRINPFFDKAFKDFKKEIMAEVKQEFERRHGALAQDWTGPGVMPNTPGEIWLLVRVIDYDSNEKNVVVRGYYSLSEEYFRFECEDFLEDEEMWDILGWQYITVPEAPQC